MKTRPFPPLLPSILRSSRKVRYFQQPEENKNQQSTNSHHFFSPYPKSKPEQREVDKSQLVLVKSVNARVEFHNQQTQVETKSVTACPAKQLPLPKEGACHGMTLFWIKQMRQHRENNYYQLVDDIAESAPSSTVSQIQTDIFYAFVSKAQNPSAYFEGGTWSNISSIKHLALSTTKQQTVALSPDELVVEFLLLVSDDEDAVCITNYVDDIPRHTIGLYRRNAKIYLFNPNYQDGRAKEFDLQFIDAVKEMNDCLYKRLGYPTPDKLHLMLNVFAAPQLAKDLKDESQAKLRPPF